MKSFFEEYGFVILAAIVVILLIAMARPIGDLVKAQITGIVDSFANKTESKLNAVDAGAISVRATTEKGKVTLTWDAEKDEDKFSVQYRVSNDKSEASWSGMSDKFAGTGKVRTFTFGDVSTTAAAATYAEADGKLNNGVKLEYKVYDSNGVVVASGAVVVRK